MFSLESMARMTLPLKMLSTWYLRKGKNIFEINIKFPRPWLQVKSYQMLSFFHQLAQNMTWILSGGFTEIILVEKYLMNINLFTKTKLICKSTFLSLWHHRTGPNVEIQLYLIQDAVVHPRFLSDFQLLKYIGIFVVWLMLVFANTCPLEVKSKEYQWLFWK